MSCVILGKINYYYYYYIPQRVSKTGVCMTFQYPLEGLDKWKKGSKEQYILPTLPVIQYWAMNKITNILQRQHFKYIFNKKFIVFWFELHGNLSGHATLGIITENTHFPVNGGFPSQRPVTWRFDVFVDLHLNKQLRRQSWGWWFDMPSCPLWRHCNVISYFLMFRLSPSHKVCHSDGIFHKGLVAQSVRWLVICVQGAWVNTDPDKPNSLLLCPFAIAQLCLEFLFCNS